MKQFYIYIYQLIISFSIVVLAFAFLFKCNYFISTIIYLSHLIIFGLIFLFSTYKINKFFLYAFTLSVSWKILIIFSISASEFTVIISIISLILWSFYETFLTIKIIKHNKKIE